MGLNDRPATAGKSHKRQPKPSAESTTLLASWYATLRKELQDVVYTLGHSDFTDPGRDKLIDRGVKVAKELGTEVDAGVTPQTAEAPGRPVRDFDS